MRKHISSTIRTVAAALCAVIIGGALWSCEEAPQQGRHLIAITENNAAEAAVADAQTSQQPPRTADQVLGGLMAGNRRFWQDHPHTHTYEHRRLHKLAHGQHPQAVVITCSDSRVSPSLVFDQGVGQLFTIRTAGHVIGDYELGSIEYAVAHLHTPLIIVLGHYDCGAIHAALSDVEENNHIAAILGTLRNEEEEQALRAQHDYAPHHYVEGNVRYHTRLLRASEPLLKTAVARMGVTVVGAVLDEETGKVIIID